LEFVFELRSLAEACIGEFSFAGLGQSRKLLEACGPVGGMTSSKDYTEFSVGTDIALAHTTIIESDGAITVGENRAAAMPHVGGIAEAHDEQ